MAARGKFQLRSTGKQVSPFERTVYPALARSLSGGSQANEDSIINSEGDKIRNDIENSNLPDGYENEHLPNVDNNTDDSPSSLQNGTFVSDLDTNNQAPPNNENDNENDDVKSPESFIILPEQTGREYGVTTASNEDVIIASHVTPSDVKESIDQSTEHDSIPENEHGPDSPSSDEQPLNNEVSSALNEEKDNQEDLPIPIESEEVSNPSAKDADNEEATDVVPASAASAAEHLFDKQNEDDCKLNPTEGSELASENDKLSENEQLVNDSNAGTTQDPDVDPGQLTDQKDEQDDVTVSPETNGKSDDTSSKTEKQLDIQNSENKSEESGGSYNDVHNVEGVEVTSVNVHETAPQEFDTKSDSVNVDERDDTTAVEDTEKLQDDNQQTIDISDSDAENEQPTVTQIPHDKENDTPIPSPPVVSTFPPLPTPPPSPPTSRKEIDVPLPPPPSLPENASTPERYYIHLPTPPSTPEVTKKPLQSTNEGLSPSSPVLQTDTTTESPYSSQYSNDNKEQPDLPVENQQPSTMMLPPPIQLVPIAFRSETMPTPTSTRDETVQSAIIQNDEHIHDLKIEPEKKDSVVSSEEVDAGIQRERYARIETKVEHVKSISEHQDTESDVQEEVSSISRSHERLEIQGEATILSEAQLLQDTDGPTSTADTEVAILKDQQLSDEEWWRPPKLLLVPATLRDSIGETQESGNHESNFKTTASTDQTEYEISTSSDDVEHQTGNDHAISAKKVVQHVSFQSDYIDDVKTDDVSDVTADSGLEKEASESEDIAINENDHESQEQNEAPDVIQPADQNEIVPDASVIVESAQNSEVNEGYDRIDRNDDMSEANPPVITVENNVISIIIGDAQDTVVSTTEREKVDGDVVENMSSDLTKENGDVNSNQQEIRNLRQAYSGRPITAYSSYDSDAREEKPTSIEYQGKEEEKVGTITDEVVTDEATIETVLITGSAPALRDSSAILPNSTAAFPSQTYASFNHAPVYHNQTFESFKQSPKKSSPRASPFARNKGAHSVDSKLYGSSQGQTSGMMQRPFPNYASIPVIKEKAKKQINKEYYDPPSGSSGTLKSKRSSVTSSKAGYAYADTRDVEMISAPMSTIPARKQKVKSEEIFMKMPPQYKYFASLDRELGLPPVNRSAETASVNAHRWFRFKAFTKRVFTETGDRFNPKNMVHFSLVNNRRQIYKPHWV